MQWLSSANLSAKDCLAADAVCHRELHAWSHARPAALGRRGRHARTYHIRWQTDDDAGDDD